MTNVTKENSSNSDELGRMNRIKESDNRAKNKRDWYDTILEEYDPEELDETVAHLLEQI